MFSIKHILRIYPKLLIKNEISILEKNFNVSIKAISIHQPSKKILGKKIKIKQINTYEKKFFTDMKYLSDSNMMFKENPIDDLPDIEDTIYDDRDKTDIYLFN